MKNIVLTAFLITAIVITFGCQNSSKEDSTIEALLDQVTQLHDVETMPKMKEVDILTMDLEDMKKNLLENPDGYDTNQLRPIDARILDLNSASTFMNKWMREYQWEQRKEEMTYDEKVAYLTDEVEKLKKLKAVQAQAISTAKSFLDTYKKNN